MKEEPNNMFLTSELLQRMNQIYEDREKEYDQLNTQYQQREESLEKAMRSLEGQKQRQEAKEAQLNELDEKLKQIKESLTVQTEDLKRQEQDLAKREEEHKTKIAEEYQKLQENIAAAEAKKQIELNEMRNQRLALDRERGEVRAMKMALSFGVSETDTAQLEEELAKRKEQLEQTLAENQTLRQQLEQAGEPQDEEARKAHQAAIEAMEEEVKKLRNEKGEQLKKILFLTSELKKTQESQSVQSEKTDEVLVPERMENYLKTQGDFSNVYILHADDGDIVTSLRGDVHFRFVFKKVPFFDLCVAREETEQLKNTIYRLNMRYNYKFCYDSDRSEAVLSCPFLPQTTCVELLQEAMEAAQCIAAE